MAQNVFVGEVATTYDAQVGRADEAMVDVLADLAAGRPALELAVGTGRVALPLAERGVEVAGIELSEDMLEVLAAKPGAERLRLVCGDMATTRVEGEFGLVYLVFNTIMNLLAQDEQVACFANAAAHLEPGGSFVVEVMVPDLRRLPLGQTAVPFSVGADRIGFDEYTDLTEAQTVWSHHHVLRPVPQVFSMPFRYVWPAELDLMARLAGLRLRDRWAGWDRSPFTGDSRSHVSVWERA